GVIGRSLRVNGRAFEIVGVAPPGFAGFTRTTPARLWIPVAAAPRLGLMGDIENRTNRVFAMVARLAPGVTIEAAQAAMNLAAARLYGIHGQPWSDASGAGRRLT